MMTKHPFDFWEKKRDVLKKEKDVPERKYNSRFKS